MGDKHDDAIRQFHMGREEGGGGGENSGMNSDLPPPYASTSANPLPSNNNEANVTPNTTTTTTTTTKNLNYPRENHYAGGSVSAETQQLQMAPANTGGTTVVIQSPPPPASIQYIAVSRPRFRDRPVNCICHNCGARVLTNRKYESGICTWLVSGAVCLFGLWCGCCLIPFCCDSCKDVEHRCPNCKAQMGVYKRL